MKNLNLYKKILQLSEKEIDELFYRCGWIDEYRGNGKSLPCWRIKEIKEGDGEDLIDTFIQEIGEDVVKRELELVNNRNI